MTYESSQHALAIIPPLDITEDVLVTTNVPDSGYPAWVNTKTYSKGDKVYLLADNSVYESLQDNNVGNNPSEPNSTHWLFMRLDNRWAAFDVSVSTMSARPGNINYLFKPGTAITSVSVLNIYAATDVTITMYDGLKSEGDIVYQKTVAIDDIQQTSGWWEFFYGQKHAPTQVILTDLPSYVNCQIDISINGGDELAIGGIVLGRPVSFGMGVKLGARVGILDYSRKETNQFGDVTLIQRAFAKRASFDMMVRKNEVDPLQQFLAAIRATPVLWIGTTEYEALTLIGYYKTFEILISYPEYSLVEFQLEGLP